MSPRHPVHAAPVQTLAQVVFELRAVAMSFADSANVFRAGMQQTFTLDDLERRYHGLGRDQLVAYLTTHCGYRGQQGKHALVHLDHVIVLDAVIRRDLGVAA